MAVLLVVCIVAGLLEGCTSAGISGEVGTDKVQKLVIGIDGDYDPFTYVNENGEFSGIDVELAREACRRMGMTPVFTPIKWDEKNELLENGTIDCIWSCFSMTGREDDYSWSRCYMYSRHVVAVRGDGDIETLMDLSGRRVAVMSSTLPESIFLSADGITIPKVGDVYCMENMSLAFSALQSGYVDAVAGHETVVQQYLDAATGEYVLLDQVLASVEVGVAFRKGRDAALIESLNGAIDSMEQDGTLKSMLESHGVGTE
jgi:polar amino acid transport system substrate-binding protein